MRYWRRAAPPFAFDSSLSLSVCDFNAISRQWRRGRGFTSSPRGGTAFRIQIDERVQPSSFLPFFLWKWNVADGLVLPLGSPSLNAHLRTNPGMSKKDKQYWGAEWSAPWPPTRRHSRIVIAGESFALSRLPSHFTAVSSETIAIMKLTKWIIVAVRVRSSDPPLGRRRIMESKQTSQCGRLAALMKKR